MTLIALIIVLVAIFVFALAMNTELSESRKTYLCVFWIPCLMLIADYAGFRFTDSLKFFVILLSLVFGIVGLILLARSKRHGASIIDIFILTDVAFFPSVYYTLGNWYF